MVDHKELLAYSLRNITHRRLRSWLTVIGIVIGIASIVALISIAQGLSKSINDQLASFGTNTVVVIPGDINKQLSFSGGPARPPSLGKLTKNDLERVKRVPGTEYVSPAITIRPNANFKAQEISVSASGVEAAYFEGSKTFELEQGRFLSDSDKHTLVIGSTLARDTFKESLQSGSVIYIGANNTKFRIVGILKKAGSAGGQADSTAYMPIEDARELAGDSIGKDEVSGIRFIVKSGFNVTETVDAVNSELLASHGVREEEKDFSFLTSDFLLKQVDTITSLLTLFLGGVASISLLVGGIGIANTMFMSVLERTREIGILKSIGADSNAIREAFLMESGLIGLIGGIFGVALGFALSLLLNALGVPALVSIELALFAFAFSLICGVISGYVPALNASKLQAIEALRYE